LRLLPASLAQGRLRDVISMHAGHGGAGQATSTFAQALADRLTRPTRAVHDEQKTTN
jgi:hypothetical protein